MTSALFEFDPTPRAVIEPAHHRSPRALPERGLMCWFGDTVRHRTAEVTPAFVIHMEHGDHPVWVLDVDGIDVAVTNPPVGGPASAFSLEILIASGVTRVIGCGGAGIVRTGFDIGHVIVPTSAVRDDGTSHHYAASEAEVGPHPDALAAIDAVLTAAGVPHDRGRTWTTDAFFRETPAKVARRREQGCITVEMEAAAMFAIAAFRGAVYGQLLYAGDDVSADEWDHRHWDRQTTARDRLFDLALQAAARV